MRTFIALDLPEEIRARLAEVQRALKPSTHTARWVAPESIHVTLKFIGEIPEKRVDDIHGALAGLTWKPFTVTVNGIGFFPGARSPRVVWAGMQAPTMEDLTKEIDVHLERLGFEKEKRMFRPHLTLARAKTTRLEAALVETAKAFEHEDFGTFTVDRFFLYQSTLKPTGSIYTKLKEYLLTRS